MALRVLRQPLRGFEFLTPCVEMVRDGFSQPFPSVKHQASQQLRLDFEEGVDVHAPVAHTNPCKGSPVGRHGVKVKNPAGEEEAWVSVLGAGSCLHRC